MKLYAVFYDPSNATCYIAATIATDQGQISMKLVHGLLVSLCT